MILHLFSIKHGDGRRKHYLGINDPYQNQNNFNEHRIKVFTLQRVSVRSSMGNCLGAKNPHAGSKEDQQRSNKLDELLRKERRELEREVKLLLLGEYIYIFMKRNAKN